VTAGADTAPLRVLAISGSLRARSSNKALLAAAALLAPADARVALFDGLAALPHFNPDLDIEPAPAAVAHWRSALREADAILVSSPEYVHGVPGALKNALDWLVSSGELGGKPLALLDTSRSHFATPQLREILTTMEARIVPEASITLHLWSNRVEAHEIVADERTANALRAAVTTLLSAAQRPEASTPLTPADEV
jgi:NAD(P)H-dependent FMN reductase